MGWLKKKGLGDNPPKDLGIKFVDKKQKYYEDKLAMIESDIDNLTHTLDFSIAMREVVKAKLKEK